MYLLQNLNNITYQNVLHKNIEGKHGTQVVS